jgi:hypothetical protein
MFWRQEIICIDNYLDGSWNLKLEWYFHKGSPIIYIFSWSHSIPQIVTYLFKFRANSMIPSVNLPFKILKTFSVVSIFVIVCPLQYVIILSG